MRIAPPEGISEGDYEAIESAVMETARGRWFLAEFARRSRVDEMRQVLDAIGRLEQVVADQRPLPADPSVRLLVQRLKEVAQQLDGLAAELRLQGQDAALCARIEAQARALGGLLRLNSGPAPAVPPAETAQALPAQGHPRQSHPREASLPPAAPQFAQPQSAQAAPLTSAEERLAALARLDRLPLAEKLALFS